MLDMLNYQNKIIAMVIYCFNKIATQMTEYYRGKWTSWANLRNFFRKL